ncbi:hypothetical protein JYT85_01465 [Desulfocapsa sp. AH-315-G09]|uniref:PhoU domain-containing protein n=1 Tax=Desulfotalea psychrophila TaxID=84980 RepID=A0ABS3AYM8_9BACT|nr:hypothetical protein [Desulfocapsa sp.]MBN4065295.1 hypothetical protein [Desulfocapsa sp. AH-315-G09]MBN4068425.1 hypothetical protein [Desulfotalea psychrophila]
MNTQVKEAARQILGNISDIQEVLCMGGSDELNLKISAIRERAAFLFEGGQGTRQIIDGYQEEAQSSFTMLIEEASIHLGENNTMNDVELLHACRLAEIFVRRAHVYFDRKARAIMEGSDAC